MATFAGSQSGGMTTPRIEKQLAKEQRELRELDRLIAAMRRIFA